MLYGIPTKRAGGLTLAGDYLDLASLHDAIHKVRPEGSEAGAEDLVLGLAYDVRKAKEGQREKVKTVSHVSEGTVYVGVKLPLVRAIFQVVYLRGYTAEYSTSPKIAEKKKRAMNEAIGFANHLKAAGKSDLAAMLRPPTEERLTVGDIASLLQFEQAVVDVLENVGVADADLYLQSVDESMKLWSDEPDPYLTDTLDHRSLYLETTKVKRLKLLKQLPEAIRPQSKFHRAILLERSAIAQEHNVSDDKIGVSWPEVEPKW